MLVIKIYATLLVLSCLRRCALLFIFTALIFVSEFLYIKLQLICNFVDYQNACNISSLVQISEIVYCKPSVLWFTVLAIFLHSWISCLFLTVIAQVIRIIFFFDRNYIPIIFFDYSRQFLDLQPMKDLMLCVINILNRQRLVHFHLAGDKI